MQALVLFSGGLDSTTTLFVARSQGFEPIALVFRYGQRHAVEVARAELLARELGVPCLLQKLDFEAIGGSALTSEGLEVPRNRAQEEIMTGSIPPTYVPARNTIFLAFALGWAEVKGIADIFLGVNALDYSGYPDCRPEYVEAFERLANLACRSTTEGGVKLRLHSPLVDKTKAEIIRWGTELGIDYSRTWSCYAPRRQHSGEPATAEDAESAVACGECDSCFLRREGFREAGLPDPTTYLVS